MTDTEIQIQLDVKHRALRSGSRWAVTRMQPDGSYDLVSAWTGGRRSLLQWLEENKVYPTREAEAQLAVIPESQGFKERS